MADDNMGFLMMAFGGGRRAEPIQDLHWQGLCLGPNKGPEAQDKPYVRGMVFRDSNCWRHGGADYVFLSAPEIDARLAQKDYWDKKGHTSLSLAIGQVSLRIAAREKPKLEIVTPTELASGFLDNSFLEKLYGTHADYYRRQDVLGRREARQAARAANP